MKRYVVGFMFDDHLQNVCMIVKNRPDWQRGLLNGVGGSIEPNECPLHAMIREFREETGCTTIASTWQHTATLRFPHAEVEFFAGKSTAAFQRATTCTDETIMKIPLADLDSYNVVENIPALLELSVQRLSDRIGVAPVAWQKTQHQELVSNRRTITQKGDPTCLKSWNKWKQQSTRLKLM